MYHAEYLFDLDVVEKGMKELLEPIGLPCPIFKNAIRDTLTYNAPRMLTQEEQARFIEVCCDELKNADLGKFIVVDAHYAGIKEAYFVPNGNESGKEDNCERPLVTVKPRKI